MLTTKDTKEITPYLDVASFAALRGNGSLILSTYLKVNLRTTYSPFPYREGGRGGRSGTHQQEENYFTRINESDL